MSYRAVVADQHFDVLFDGPAVARNQLPIDTLASSLLALSAATQAAHLAIDPLAPRISLDIQAHRAGSFSVDLLITDAVNTLTTPGAEALVTGGSIVGTVYAAMIGSIRLLKWMRNRSIRSVDDAEEGRTRITATDGSTVIVDSTVYVTVRDRAFRESIREAVEPVSRDGIDYIDIGRPEDRERVTTDDYGAFTVPDDEEVLSDTTRDAYLQLINVSFQPGAKWKFTEGASPYFARVDDADFVARVEAHEVEFGKGDILQARVRTQQLRNGTTLRVENTVIHVVNVVKRARDVELPFGEEGQ